MVGNVLSKTLRVQSAWIAGPYAAQQVVRLGTNIVLAGLLAPEMFGIMLLVNTLRIGAELLSDIGIGQCVVRSPHGEEQRFLDVAWTLQLLRGIALMLIGLAAAIPIGRIYGQPELGPVVAAMSLLFLITGLQSPALYLLQRRMQVRTRALFDFSWTIVQCVITILLAIVLPSVWALVLGTLSGTLFTTISSFFIGPRVRPRLAWDPVHVREIFAFGRWIFLSTAVYFAATSADKMYFVAAMSLTLAGVYAIARTFSELFGKLAQRAGAMLVFPKLAALGDARGEAAGRLRHKRRMILAVVAVAIAGAMAVSDRAIMLLYDDRYLLAAFMLPIMFASVWFKVLGTFAESMLMGCGRAAPGAAANTMKFAILLIGLPLAMAHWGVFAALLVLILAEIGRWLTLAPPLQKEGLASIWDDLSLTLLAAAGAVTFKFVLGWLGIVPTIDAWWALGRPLYE